MLDKKYSALPVNHNLQKSCMRSLRMFYKNRSTSPAPIPVQWIWWNSVPRHGKGETSVKLS